MAIASLLLGILALLGVCLALVPLLNVVNCIMLPLALFGLILGIAAWMKQSDEEERDKAAMIGIVLNSLALLVGIVRMLASLLTTGGIL